jgi:hypothetical protein
MATEHGAWSVGEALMGRKLFCEIGPAAYRISQEKEIWLRHVHLLQLLGLPVQE